MKALYKILLIWCMVNFPMTFVFYDYDYNFLGSLIFLVGFIILNIVGLLFAHKEDNRRNVKNVK